MFPSKYSKFLTKKMIIIKKIKVKINHVFVIRSHKSQNYLFQAMNIFFTNLRPKDIFLKSFTPFKDIPTKNYLTKPIT